MATKIMVKLKITRYNLKGVDDWFRQECFFYCRFSGRGHMKSTTVVSDKPSPALQCIDLKCDPLPLFQFSSHYISLNFAFVLRYLIWYLLHFRLKNKMSGQMEEPGRMRRVGHQTGFSLNNGTRAHGLPQVGHR